MHFTIQTVFFSYRLVEVREQKEWRHITHKKTHSESTRAKGGLENVFSTHAFGNEETDAGREHTWIS